MGSGTEASWLADGVKEIERVVKASMEPKIIKIDQEKPGTYGVVVPGPADKPNKIETKIAGPLWHNERLETPEQLANFIASMKEHRGRKPAEAAIYIGRDAIRYCFSFEDRRDRAVCPLIYSQPWKWLSCPQNPMDQRAIIRLLRITFAGALPPDSPLILTLRKVRWNQNGHVEGDLQRGKEALGRQILNEAAGIENFPDEFVLTVPVYENVKFTVQVRVALELLPEQQKFELIPFPNQLQDGLTATLLNLRELISATGAPTFIGSPSPGKED